MKLCNTLCIHRLKKFTLVIFVITQVTNFLSYISAKYDLNWFIVGKVITKNTVLAFY